MDRVLGGIRRGADTGIDSFDSNSTEPLEHRKSVVGPVGREIGLHA